MSMTKGERNDLARLIRQRGKVMKAATVQRSAELLADFEHHMASIYHYDQDDIWKEANALAKKAAIEAQTMVAERCKELGIPKEFAPGISAGWHSQGENAVASRRAELRRVAKTKIDVLEKTAKTEIEKHTIEAESALILDGLTSDAALEFFNTMPSAEALMPSIEYQDVLLLLEKSIVH